MYSHGIKGVNSYYRQVLHRPWRLAIANMTLADVEAFLRFHLDSEQGRGGRRKRQILISRSLQTFWNNFRLLYRREMLTKIDLKILQMAATNVSPADPLSCSQLTCVPDRWSQA